MFDSIYISLSFIFLPLFQIGVVLGFPFNGEGFPFFDSDIACL
jgi:hypothetical protein